MFQVVIQVSSASKNISFHIFTRKLQFKQVPQLTEKFLRDIFSRSLQGVQIWHVFVYKTVISSAAQRTGHPIRMRYLLFDVIKRHGQPRSIEARATTSIGVGCGRLDCVNPRSGRERHEQ